MWPLAFTLSIEIGMREFAQQHVLATFAQDSRCRMCTLLLHRCCDMPASCGYHVCCGRGLLFAVFVTDVDVAADHVVAVEVGICLLASTRKRERLPRCTLD